LIPHHARKTNPSGLGQRLQPGSDIDTVAKQVPLVDNDISEMDADAKPHLLALWAVLVLFCDCVLDRDSAFDRIHRAGEIGDHAVPGGIEDSAAIGGNQSIEDCPICLKPPQRAELIQPHQAAVLGNVGRKDGGKLSFDYLTFCHRPSSRALLPEPIRLTP
jgi:hypothetical protein